MSNYSLLSNDTDLKDFIRRWEVEGYLAICAPRRSGKTTFLMSIIQKNPKMRFLVVAPNADMLHVYTRNFYNVSSEVYDKNRINYGMFGVTHIIGDEVYLPRMVGVTVACAFSPKSNMHVVPDPDKDIIYVGSNMSQKRFVWKNISGRLK